MHRFLLIAALVALPLTALAAKAPKYRPAKSRCTVICYPFKEYLVQCDKNGRPTYPKDFCVKKAKPPRH